MLLLAFCLLVLLLLSYRLLSLLLLFLCWLLHNGVRLSVTFQLPAHVVDNVAGLMLVLLNNLETQALVEAQRGGVRRLSVDLATQVTDLVLLT